MKQFNQIKDQLQSAQEELKKMTATGSSGGGMVNLTVTGEFKVLKVEIADEVFALGDKSMLEMLIASAFNDAMAKIQTEIQGRGSRLASSYGIKL